MELHLLDRGRLHADLNFALEAETVATQSNPEPTPKYDEFVVWNLLIDHPEATVLWDTGSHPEAGQGHWPRAQYETFTHVDAHKQTLPTALDAVGYDTTDIDIVVQSHLHLDHAGGLYQFEETATPIYVHRRELEHAYLNAAIDNGDAAYIADDFDRELNWQLVEIEHELLPGIELLHLPGHTPGLLGAHIQRSSDPDLLIAGDQAFLAPNYEQERSMSASLVYDTQAWRQSLQQLKRRQRQTNAEVLYGHDPDQFHRLRETI